MREQVNNQLKKTKNASFSLIQLSEETRTQVLVDLAQLLRQSVAQIIAENAKDLALMDKADPKYDRLLLNAERINAMAHDLETVASLSYPNKQIVEHKTLPNGLKLQKMVVPLGVIAIIYESRPNVTIDTFSLCFKTANACVLKGGKEANFSNKMLLALIHKVLEQHHISTSCVYLLPLEREALDTLLHATHLVDVCIPRGSQALIDFVREHARIPFIETGAGIVHTYFDRSGDINKGRAVITNAKTRRVSVCNALDTLIIHESRLADLAFIVQDLAQKDVGLYVDDLAFKALENSYPKQLLHHATADDFGREFLDYKMAIKTVADMNQALEHIKTYSSGHSEAIIAEDLLTNERFVEQVDAAAVYVNASTAFTDGAQFGMGAEIGISTQKLHARGPMGLDALSSYKWVVLGSGQIRL